jgi:hypothetical protein
MLLARDQGPGPAARNPGGATPTAREVDPGAGIQRVHIVPPSGLVALLLHQPDRPVAELENRLAGDSPADSATSGHLFGSPIRRRRAEYGHDCS